MGIKGLVGKVEISRYTGGKILSREAKFTNSRHLRNFFRLVTHILRIKGVEFTSGTGAEAYTQAGNLYRVVRYRHSKKVVVYYPVPRH